MTALGPVPCQGCRKPVRWTGSRWSSGRSRHICPGPRCGALMKSRDRCARTMGHGYDHRSSYALENARVARSGRAA